MLTNGLLSENEKHIHDALVLVMCFALSKRECSHTYIHACNVFMKHKATVFDLKGSVPNCLTAKILQELHAINIRSLLCMCT